MPDDAQLRPPQNRFPFANQSGYRRLYHYEEFNEEYFTGLLRDQRIHCSSASNLNDPWDCRPFFDAGFTRFPDQRRLWIEWWKATQGGVPIPPDELKRMDSDPEHLLKEVFRLSVGFGKLICERWGIYCLTPIPTSTLMWSHYAKNHTGICLEYSLENNKLFPNACKVEYRTEYPSLSPVTLKDHRQLLLTKSADWSYEEEFRLLARLQSGPFDSHPLGPVFRAVDGFLPLPPVSLTSVIVGCENKEAELIRRLVNEHMPGLPTKRAVRFANQYKLRIDEDSFSRQTHEPLQAR